MKKLIVCFMALLTMGCANKRLSSSESGCNMLRPVVIYKTTSDFSNNIPIGMNETKTEIVSYPGISDVSDNKKPILLDNGYLIDRFGLSVNSVYTSYTYEEYKNLPKQPSIKDLQARVIEMKPFTEMYIYNKSTFTIDELNQEISNGFSNSRKIQIH